MKRQKFILALMWILRRHFILICAFLFCLSCNKKTENEIEEETVEERIDAMRLAIEQCVDCPKWKLAGIIDVETGELQVLEPRHCEECYTLTFDTDSTAYALSIWGIYHLNFLNLDVYCDTCWPDNYDYYYERPRHFSCIPAERYNSIPCEDSGLFRHMICRVASYEAASDELKLFFTYFDKIQYLLFKPIPFNKHHII